MEKTIGIKRIGTELFVAVEKDWVQIDEATKQILLNHYISSDIKEDIPFKVRFQFDKVVVVRQYREVGVENQKHYERWITLNGKPKPGKPKPFYYKRRELAVFTLTKMEDALEDKT